MVRAMSEAPTPFIYLAVPCYGGNLNLYFVRSLLARVSLASNSAMLTRAIDPR